MEKVPPGTLPASWWFFLFTSSLPFSFYPTLRHFQLPLHLPLTLSVLFPPVLPLPCSSFSSGLLGAPLFPPCSQPFPFSSHPSSLLDIPVMWVQSPQNDLKGWGEKKGGSTNCSLLWGRPLREAWWLETWTTMTRSVEIQVQSQGEG